MVLNGKSEQKQPSKIEEKIEKKGITRNMQIAKTLLDEGLNIKYISDVTGLTIEEIRKL